MPRIGRFVLKILIVLIVGIAILALYNKEKITRLYKVLHLFDEDVIVDNFLHMEDIFSVDTIHRNAKSFDFQNQGGYSLPGSFTLKDSVISVTQYLDSSQTTGLLVLHADTIIYESYYRGNTPNTTHISWSVAKSMVSASIGKAIEEGFIKSVLDPITDYVPALKGSGYDGVRIKDILQMSSGIGFDEDYQKFNSDINRLGRYFALGLSLDKFCGTLDQTRAPGTFHQYVSMDTQVLGMLIQEATGMDFADYFETRIWQAIGAEHEAYWIQDNKGMEAVFGGMNACLRDYGRFAYLYANQGEMNGQKILRPEWIRESTTPDGPHLMPGDNPLSSSDLGYAYQWWIPEGDHDEFMAIGVYNQYIYIYPARKIAIIKTSANLKFKTEKRKTNHEAIAFFRSIVSSLNNAEGQHIKELDPTF
jgi:CubicO group peptidase (beta-lactamase class C family)